MQEAVTLSSIIFADGEIALETAMNIHWDSNPLIVICNLPFWLTLMDNNPYFAEEGIIPILIFDP